jgi:MFS family permease
MPTPPSKFTLPVVLATTLLTTVNTAIVNVALTGIRNDLGFAAATISWVINGYLLTYGGLLIVGGRLGDVIGRRRTLLFGLTVFTIASAVAGFAWNPTSLIAARAVQGVGGALAAPAVLAIVTQLYDGRARAKALSWFSIVLGVGLSLGMIVGGAVLQWLSWRWIFWFNVPVGASLFALTLGVVPAMRAHQRHRLDLLGATLTTVSTVGIVLAFVQIAKAHTFDATVGISSAVAIVGLAGLVLRLRLAAEPLIPSALFTRASAVGAYVANALQAGAMTGVVFFLSQLFSGGLKLAPLGVGALFLVFTAPQFASALAAKRLVRALGVRRLVTTGLSFSIVGLVLLAEAARTAEISVLLIVAMALTGLGAGVVYFGVNLTVMSTVEPHFAGAASGLVQTSVQLGASVGIAVLVLVQSFSGTAGALLAAAIFLAIAIGAISVRDRTAAVTAPA